MAFHSDGIHLSNPLYCPCRWFPSCLSKISEAVNTYKDLRGRSLNYLHKLSSKKTIVAVETFFGKSHILYPSKGT